MQSWSTVCAARSRPGRQRRDGQARLGLKALTRRGRWPALARGCRFARGIGDGAAANVGVAGLPPSVPAGSLSAESLSARYLSAGGPLGGGNEGPCVAVTVGTSAALRVCVPAGAACAAAAHRADDAADGAGAPAGRRPACAQDGAEAEGAVEAEADRVERWGGSGRGSPAARGLFAYVLCRGALLLGGALSDAGSVRAWLRHARPRAPAPLARTTVVATAVRTGQTRT
jgi:hypothetical protein